MSAPSYNTVIYVHNRLNSAITDGQWDVKPAQSYELPTRVDPGSNSPQVTIQAQTGLFPQTVCRNPVLVSKLNYAIAGVGTQGMITFKTIIGGNTVYLWMWFSSNNNHQVVQSWASNGSVFAQRSVTSGYPLTGTLLQTYFE